jgi:hypothetical protein
MYRKSGLIVLALGAALTYSLAFTTFDTQVRRWERTEDGGRERATINCPVPWGRKPDPEPLWPLSKVIAAYGSRSEHKT